MGRSDQPAPAVLSEDITGDFYVPAGETMKIEPSPDYPWVLDGNLLVEEGATILAHGPIDVTGTLTMEAGSSVLSDSDARLYWYFDADSFVVRGTREAPVILEGPYITPRFDHVDISYAKATAFDFKVFNRARRDVFVRDSEFFGASGSHPVSGFDIIGNGSASSVVEHNRFDNMYLRTSFVHLHHNVLIDSNPDDRYTGDLVITDETLPSGPSIACEGSRDRDPDIVMKDNTVRVHVIIDRDFGEVDMSGNYIDEEMRSERWLYDSTTAETGCTSAMLPDGDGAYGGPVTYEPALDAPPEGVGPRP